MAKILSGYRQRELLIKTGFEIAEKLPPARLNARAITTHAGLPLRSFSAQFPDLETYLAEIQDVHHQELREHTLEAIQGLQPGIDRCLRGAHAFLDFSFLRRGLRQWVSEARAQSAEIERRWRTDNLLYLQFIASELALSGWPQPAAGARLFIAAMVALTRHEQHDGRKHPGSRRTIEHFLRTYQRYL